MQFSKSTPTSFYINQRRMFSSHLFNQRYNQPPLNCMHIPYIVVGNNQSAYSLVKDLIKNKKIDPNDVSFFINKENREQFTQQTFKSHASGIQRQNYSFQFSLPHPLVRIDEGKVTHIDSERKVVYHLSQEKSQIKNEEEVEDKAYSYDKLIIAEPLTDEYSNNSIRGYQRSLRNHAHIINPFEDPFKSYIQIRNNIQQLSTKDTNIAQTLRLAFIDNTVQSEYQQSLYFLEMLNSVQKLLSSSYKSLFITYYYAFEDLCQDRQLHSKVFDYLQRKDIQTIKKDSQLQEINGEEVLYKNQTCKINDFDLLFIKTERRFNREIQSLLQTLKAQYSNDESGNDNESNNQEVEINNQSNFIQKQLQFMLYAFSKGIILLDEALLEHNNFDYNKELVTNYAKQLLTNASQNLPNDVHSFQENKQLMTPKISFFNDQCS